MLAHEPVAMWEVLLAPSKALNCLACCWLGQPVSKGRSKWAGLIYMFKNLKRYTWLARD
jgi:hypothetical protein